MLFLVVTNPSISNAFEKVLQKKNSSFDEEFFVERERQFKKLYKSYNLRDFSQKLKTKNQIIDMMEIIKEIILTKPVELILQFSVIHLNPLFYK